LSDRSPAQAKQRATSAILAALADGKKNWSNLLAITRLSRKTLHGHLAQLQKDGQVIRVLDSKSEKYPPPVYYYLTEQARKEAQPLLDLMNFFRALGDIDAAIITKPAATVEAVVRNANLTGGPVLILFLKLLLHYNYKPDQIGIPLGLFYTPRLEALARNVYAQLLNNKTEADAALDESLKPYTRILYQYTQATGASLPGINLSLASKSKIEKKRHRMRAGSASKRRS
jgi:DNA-binding HxlR family transcriptional regulator